MASSVAPRLSSSTTVAYAARAPAQSLLYRLVAEHLASFLQSRAEQDGFLPAFVRRAFEAFLACGVLAYGFVRVYCRTCRLDRLVAFSCKGRALCPSCGVRRMVDGAAHLVDCVLPRAPVRQWVLSLPHSLRFKLAFDAALCSQVMGIFVRAVSQHLRRQAKLTLSLPTIRMAHTGSVTVIQRFSSALSLNLHFHALFLDGVVVEGGQGPLEFRALPAPSRAQLLAIAQRVCREVGQLMRAGIEDEGAGSTACGTRQMAEPLLAACAAASVMGRVGTGPEAGRPVRRLGHAWQPSGALKRLVGRFGADVDGFNLHAGVRVPAHDRKRLEGLCRYVLRPALNQGLLRPMADGRISYTLKRPWSDGTQAVSFTPHQLLEKLAVLVPPPRAHQVVYHGVLAPNARLRPEVVPKSSHRDQNEIRRKCTHPGRPNRLDWASLMRRVYALDVLQCPRCGDRMAVIAALTQTAAIRAILRACGLDAEAPARGPAGRRTETFDWGA